MAKNLVTAIDDIRNDDMLKALEELTIYKSREPKYETTDIKDYIDDWKENRCSD